jgi:uncharacterized protein YbaP (TraB family)
LWKRILAAAKRRSATSSYPPLAERLSASQLAELQERAGEMGLSIALFDSQPLWQVAMVLQATQAQKLGLRADYGIDYQLLMAARESNIRVMELEEPTAR